MLTIVKSSLSKKKILELIEFCKPKSLTIELDYKVREVTSYAFRGEFTCWFYSDRCCQVLICYGDPPGDYGYPQLIERSEQEVKDGYIKKFIIRDILESFIYVCSHECRHSYQYQKNLFSMRDLLQSKKQKRLAETDADKYAMKKMREWRKSQCQN